MNDKILNKISYCMFSNYKIGELHSLLYSKINYTTVLTLQHFDIIRSFIRLKDFNKTLSKHVLNKK